MYPACVCVWPVGGGGGGCTKEIYEKFCIGLDLIRIMFGRRSIHF